MDYHPSRLVRLKSKGNKWYVQVTKPLELQDASSKQERRSTGTTDRKVAERKQHAKTQEIYAKFDQLLGKIDQAPRPKFNYITTPPEDPLFMYRPWPAFQPDEPERRIVRLRPTYISERRWNRKKTMKGADSHIREFSVLVGNIQVDRIKKKHAYDYASYLDELGRANSTIKTRVSSVKNLLTWCEQRGHVEYNPFRDLSLRNYGEPSKHYKPLTKHELALVFQQEMPAQDRLCLSILALTGMRLDEVALLEWDQVQEEDGIVFFDLTGGTVKNPGSERKVPLHSEFQLPRRTTGRIFSYQMDDDGKAQGDASKNLMPWIRNIVGSDPQKVVHSLRGTFKDMMRNSGTSKELNDFITGHSSGDTAGSYGEGHGLRLRSLAIENLSVDFLNQL
ncbi:DUF6538 domain-containing protein [Ascidiaceihabitans sp.]|uniref:DUF6538 domain-containing protein n=1 Tax=Ascidiaceihabitans sp. TaxID=1872644 RepID=UPI0032980EA1